MPAQSDSARWGSARAASDSSSPTLADSALARVSSTARSDSPVLSDSARAGASARLLSDSPALSDGATAGLHAPINAGDSLSVSDGAAFESSGSAAPGGARTVSPGGSSGGGGGGVGSVPTQSSGNVGVRPALIHAVSYDRCSDEPYAEVTTSSSERTVVTLVQAGARTVAYPAGASGALDSSVWRASILSDAMSLEIRAAVHSGSHVSEDTKYLDLGSCSGTVRFTALGTLPTAETRAPEPDAEPPEPEDLLEPEELSEPKDLLEPEDLPAEAGRTDKRPPAALRPDSSVGRAGCAAATRADRELRRRRRFDARAARAGAGRAGRAACLVRRRRGRRRLGGSAGRACKTEARPSNIHGASFAPVAARADCVRAPLPSGRGLDLPVRAFVAGRFTVLKYRRKTAIYVYKPVLG